ncbi:hypothetical protein AAEX63_03920 [Luteococcus sp. H138]|uniref:hypothetical protein n=1 Tax=unclassified Luteococcus TaxID=2639923 RepID=UPI00313F06AE
MSTTVQIKQQWVTSAPFRAHFQLILEQTGLPWRVLALAIGLPIPLARRLALAPPGRHRIRVEDARRLIAVSPEDLAGLSTELVGCRTLSRRLRELQDGGMDALTIAHRAGVTPSQVQQLASGAVVRCSRLTLLRMLALIDELDEVPGAARRRPTSLPDRAA